PLSIRSSTVGGSIGPKTFPSRFRTKICVPAISGNSYPSPGRDRSGRRLKPSRRDGCQPAAPRGTLDRACISPTTSRKAVVARGRNPGEGRRRRAEALSSGLRLAPSTGVLSPDGILGPAVASRPRMNKRGQGHRLRGSRASSVGRRRGMRYVGIDIAAEKHFVAVVGEASEVLLKRTPVGEGGGGDSKPFPLLGEPSETLVAMEATGHYWKNLYAALAARGFAVALLNPVRTRRFAEEDLQRTKTDAIDALGIARFAAQKRPRVSRMPDSATEELR